MHTDRRFTFTPIRTIARSDAHTSTDGRTDSMNSENKIQRTMRCADLPDLYCLYSQSIHIQINGTTGQKSLGNRDRAMTAMQIEYIYIFFLRLNEMLAHSIQ